MKEQTAVDWLEKFLKERYTLMDSEAIFQHAKEMEKEQIRSAFVVGKWDGKDRDINSEQYYNETYGYDT
jgi:hypothetical protein